MKKIIIISYYSKPSNFVGAERIQGWLSHLSKNGVYPVLVTRFWKENQVDNGNINLPKENRIEKNKNYEIHRISLSESFRPSACIYITGFPFLDKSFKNVISKFSLLIII